ncbi:MAG: DUF4430 domain-containing protein [Methanomassiliicoccales archaeon]|jgi:hypothetical protein
MTIGLADMMVNGNPGGTGELTSPMSVASYGPQGEQKTKGSTMVSPYKSRKGDKKSVLRILAISAVIMVLIAAFYISYSVFFASGPEVPPAEGYVFGDSRNVTVIISQDFGEEVLKTITVDHTDGLTALAALEMVADVDKSGEYVNAIDGLRSRYSSGTPVDWFYYVNGISATVYALFYELNPGDVMRWDYHWWISDSTGGCISADLFSGFAYGYRGVENGGIWPTYIVDCGGFSDEAERLHEAFIGWGINSTAVLWSNLDITAKERGNLFLVGTFDSEMVGWVNDNYGDMGLFFHYDGTKVDLLDPTVRDKVTLSMEHCGLVISARNPWNPVGVWSATNLCWMATGVTHADVQAALDILIGDPQVLSDKFGGFAVLEDDVYEVY